MNSFHTNRNVTETSVPRGRNPANAGAMATHYLQVDLLFATLIQLDSDTPGIRLITVDASTKDSRRCRTQALAISLVRCTRAHS